MPDPATTREQMLDTLRASGIRQTTMTLWIEPGRPVAIEDERLVLAYPSHLFAWVQRHYAGLLGEAARKHGLAGVRLKTTERSAA